MIGFFDSGFGGLQTMKYFYDIYPDYDYIFLADSKNCPFGVKSGEEIQQITFKALDRLFDNGAEIVIIACNTAAAHSIRKWQKLYPDKKTLSITVPGIEKIISSNSNLGSIGVLATQATVASDIYNDLYFRFGGKGESDFHFVIASELVDLVESGVEDVSIITPIINNYLSKIPSNISNLILGCTHFSVYKDHFQKLFKGNVIDPSYCSVQKFTKYLSNHPEIEIKISKKSSIKFYTTGYIQKFDEIGSKIWGEKISSINALI